MKKKEKYPKSRYCEYYHSCDKEISCKDGNFCEAFRHTKDFSSLRFENKRERRNYNG
ncbi:MAG: hypothetical protein WC346_10155 [Methanogenium sp.]